MTFDDIRKVSFGGYHKEDVINFFREQEAAHRVQLEKLIAEADALRVAQKNFSTQLGELQESIALLQSEKESLEAENAQLREVVEEEYERISTLVEKNKTLTEQSEQTSGNTDVLYQRISDLEDELEQKNLEVETTTMQCIGQLNEERERYAALEADTADKIARFEQLQLAAVTAEEIIAKANEQAQGIVAEADAILEEARNSVEPVREEYIHHAKVEADGILFAAKEQAKDLVAEAQRQAEGIQMQTRNETEQLGRECSRIVEDTRNTAQRIIADAQNQAKDAIFTAQVENAQLAAEKRQLEKETGELLEAARLESKRISDEMDLKLQLERKKMDDYQTEIAAFKQKMLENMEGLIAGLDLLN